MPYPSQVNQTMIVERARELIEANGIDQLTLQTLAGSLGVQAPSLYRHVKNKTELLRAVNEVTIHRLIETLGESVATTQDPTTRLLRIAHAYREFALTNPITYTLAFTITYAELQPDATRLERLVLPLQDTVAELTGVPDSLTALRGLWALVHGYVSAELSGQFRRGGDLSATYETVVRAYLRGWTGR